MIDSFNFQAFKVVLASFQVENKLRKARVFYLLAKISIKIVLGMLFFTFNNGNIYLIKKKLIKATLNQNVEAFAIYIISLNLSSILIYPARKL